MLSKYILPGEKIELQTIQKGMSNNGMENKKVYSSKVFDILSEDRLEITMPMEKTKLILLPMDSEYDMYFYTKTGLYQCVARIVDRYKSNNIYILVLEIKTNLKKFQRREFYRFSCAILLEARLLEKEEVAMLEKGQPLQAKELPMKRGVIVDISGGGARFVSEDIYEAGSLIYCQYQLEAKTGSKMYKVATRVLRTKALEGKPQRFEYRVQYVNLREGEREEIIRYVFEQERKCRQKEKEQKE